MDILHAIGIIVGVMSGIAGLVLGILNLIYQRDTTRARLRVRPKIMHIVDRTPEIGGAMSEKNVGVMEVCNVGHVPVIGSTIGFLPKQRGERGLLVVSPQPLSGSGWPGEIQPGHMIMLRMNLDGVAKPIESDEIGRAYVASIVGDTFRASRKDMRAFKADLQRAAAERRPAAHPHRTS